MLETEKKRKNGKTKKKRRVGARFVHNTRYKTYLSITVKMCCVLMQDTAATNAN